MHNVKTETKNGKLVITIDISETAVNSAPPSKTGKTRLLATTSGSLRVDCGVENLSLALNCMIPR